MFLYKNNIMTQLIEKINYSKFVNNGNQNMNRIYLKQKQNILIKDIKNLKKMKNKNSSKQFKKLKITSNLILI